MLRIRALNRESSSDDDIPIIRKEAQEEIALELYNKALRLQATGKLEEPKDILLQLINNNIPELESQGGLPKSMSTLKYSCFLNVGNIFIKTEDLNSALDYFISASELDGNDVTLWYKIGNLALQLDRFRQAIFAFSKGLECSDAHWPSLDKLISILYAVQDTIGCLVYISRALLLDAGYSKGLILRKKIYKDNPATMDYYKLYYPDVIWEPPLTVVINEEEEALLLKEVEELSKRIKVIEKSLGPKPLPTIALPRALEDYTWVELGKTLIELHNYITNNKMSHFSLVDLSRCMSQNREEEAVQVDKEPVLEIQKVQEEKQLDIKSSQVDSKDNKIEEQQSERVEAEAVIERRFSTTSDNNTEQGQENTPVQTDNDEEQAMDAENLEEQEDNFENKEDKSIRPTRGPKRKRDLLSDLQIWGWHSKRKQTKRSKTEKDFTIEDALHRIIPKHLLQNKIGENLSSNNNEDSMNTMDIYNMYFQDHQINKFLSPIHSPKSVSSILYFGTERENDDVQKLWSKTRDYCDAVILIQEFIRTLSRMWQIQWPKELVSLYIEIYGLYRQHFDHPPVLMDYEDFNELCDDALATLLYSEIICFNTNKEEHKILHVSSLGFLQITSNWKDKWQENFVAFFIRVNWLRTHIFRKEGNNDLAIGSLQLIQEIIREQEEDKNSEKFILHLPNCIKCGVVTSEINEKLLKHLDMIASLACLEDLYNKEKYVEVADIIKITFNALGGFPTYGKMGRPAQLAMLLHALWFTDLTECFIWNEKCLYEAVEHFLKPNKDPDKWEKIVEKSLAIFYEIIQKETVSIVDVLNEENRARLVESLSKIVWKQLNTSTGRKMLLDCVTPWILLHFVLLRDEHRQQANKKVSHVKDEKIDVLSESPPEQLVELDLPPSIAILFSGHEFLGPKGWCLTEQGRLLHFMLDTVLERLDTPIFEMLREKIDIHIEQSLFCLYQHPSKKNKVSRHLADHNVDPLRLSWQKSFQLYEFYGPDCLPEFNSFKNASISSDLEQLLQRIIALVPSSCDPNSILLKVLNFVQGKTNVLHNPVEFPNKVRAIYYLLGDFYFKQKEFNRGIKYFLLDLCINPLRLDSWACLALSYTSQLESKLNYCKKMKSEMEFLDKAKCAQVCYKQALKLSNDIVLWIESGSFEYMVHSFCSRILKYDSETFSMEKFEQLENLKNSYLDSSGLSFEKALELYEPEETDTDERWLQYYILGKISEKKHSEPNEYLQYYLTALSLLHENNAQYPDKIHYYSPQHLSVEVLEVHYRIYASILKYIELHEGKLIPCAIGKQFKRTLTTAAFPKKIAPKLVAATEQPAQPQAPSNDTKQYVDVQVESSKTSGPLNCDFSSAFHNFIKNSTTNSSADDDCKYVEVNQEGEVKCGNKIVEPEMKSDKNVVVLDLTEDDDVILLTDSDEDEKAVVITGQPELKIPETDKNNIKEQSNEAIKETSENSKEKLDVVNVQEVLDKMMEETMKKSLEETMDLDYESTILVTSKEYAYEPDKSSSPSDKCKSPMDVSDLQLVDEIDTEIEEYENRATNTKESHSNKCSPKHKSDGSETDDNIRKSLESSSSNSSSSSCSSSSDSDSDDDSSSSSSSSSSEESSDNMSNSDISHIINLCIAGLEQCALRLGQNYKALYRLAHLYYNYKPKKDISKCRQLLLGEYKCKENVILSGLFVDRKTNNFFNGIWRIPSTEIDRPGSLAAHMSRCISLLLQVLRTSNDHKTLLDLCLMLKKAPDHDKIYIKDSERLQFSEQAMTMCIQCLQEQMKNIHSMKNSQIQKFLYDIFKLYQKVQKHMPNRDNKFSSILTEVYKKYMKDKVPENLTSVDLAVRYCLQNKGNEKPHKTQHKPQTNAAASLPRAPTQINTPVLPTPSNLQPVSSQPLKRPGAGRPRGRPPLPKIPGQPKTTRGRNPNVPATCSYQPYQKPLYDQTLAFEYFKHYQEELIKQYSQTMTISQLTQLSQYLTQNLSATQTQIPNTYLSPQTTQSNSVLSPANLLRQVTSGAVSNQLMDSLNQLNPNLKKKVVDNVPAPHSNALANLSTEQIKLLTSYFNNSVGGKNVSFPNLPSAMSSSFTQQHHLPHSSVSVPATTKVKVANFETQKPGSSSSVKYTTASQVKKAKTSVTKTTSSSSVFKKQNSNHPLIMQPSTSKNILKSQGGFSPDKRANILMKERPNISITPVISTAATVTSFVPPNTVPQVSSPYNPSTSPGKTLQEKLADKKKEISNKQLAKTFEAAEIIPKDLNISPVNASAIKKSFNIPSIPASLSVSKASTGPPLVAHTDTGLSISQVQPVPSTKAQKEQQITKKAKSNLPYGNNVTTIPPAYQTFGLNLSPSKDKHSLSQIPKPNIAATITPVEISAYSKKSLPKTEIINITTRPEINVTKKKETNISSSKDYLSLLQNSTELFNLPSKNLELLSLAKKKKLENKTEIINISMKKDTLPKSSESYSGVIKNNEIINIPQNIEKLKEVGVHYNILSKYPSISNTITQKNYEDFGNKNKDIKLPPKKDQAKLKASSLEQTMPLSLSVTKQSESQGKRPPSRSKSSSDDDVIFIE